MWPIILCINFCYSLIFYIYIFKMASAQSQLNENRLIYRLLQDFDSQIRIHLQGIQSASSSI